MSMGKHGDEDRPWASLGSVISGTLKLEELAGAFADAIEPLDTERRYRHLVSEAKAPRADDDELSELVEELRTALEEAAPPYCYFGAHPGDRADFGFWPDWDAINADRRDGVLPSGDSLPDSAPAGQHYLHISDHGNAELYTWDERSRRWRSEWGVV